MHQQPRSLKVTDLIIDPVHDPQTVRTGGHAKQNVVHWRQCAAK